MKRAWCSLECNKCFKVGRCWLIFDFVSKHQCFGFDSSNYGKPVEAAKQWGGVISSSGMLGLSLS